MYPVTGPLSFLQKAYYTVHLLATLWGRWSKQTWFIKWHLGHATITDIPLVDNAWLGCHPECQYHFHYLAIYVLWAPCLLLLYGHFLNESIFLCHLIYLILILLHLLGLWSHLLPIFTSLPFSLVCQFMWWKYSTCDVASLDIIFMAFSASGRISGFGLPRKRKDMTCICLHTSVIMFWSFWWNPVDWLKHRQTHKPANRHTGSSMF